MGWLRIERSYTFELMILDDKIDHLQNDISSINKKIYDIKEMKKKRIDIKFLADKEFKQETI